MPWLQVHSAQGSAWNTGGCGQHMMRFNSVHFMMSTSYAPEILNCIPRAAQATVETMRTRKAIPVHLSAKSTHPGPYSRFLCKKLWKV